MASLDLQLDLALGEFGLQIEQRIELDGITALFGPSGSGKTTLLRIIAGLEDRATGLVHFAGECWQDNAARRRVPTHRRGVGLVFQDARLFAHLSVRGNLDYAMRRSTPRRPRIDRHDVIAAFDLETLLDRPVDSLSGGERQRVAIGRTLLNGPGLLLMDEPLAALDQQRKRELIPYIEDLPERFGVPVVYVTHAIDEVARLADQMVVLTDGRILTSGAATEVLENLALLPLTGAFETSALLPGEVLAHDTRYALTAVAIAGGELVIPALDLPVGTSLRLRVRARDVAIARHQPDALSIRNILPVTILDIAGDADHAFAEILLDLAGDHLRARITRASVADLNLAVGDAVFALVKSIAVDRSLFSGQT